MKGMLGQALDAHPAEVNGQPVVGIVVGSLGALALWVGIVGLISLIV